MIFADFSVDSKPIYYCHEICQALFSSDYPDNLI